MLLLLNMYFKLVSIFTRPTILSGIILNIMMINATFVLFVVFIRKAFSNKAAILSVFVWILFLPFWLYIPIFYTDTFSLPFMMGAILLAYQLIHTDVYLTESKYSIVIGIILCTGMLLKTSVAILFIGILIFIVFFKSWKHSVVCCSLVAVGFLFVYGSFHLWSSNTSMVDLTDSENLKKPYTHYLMMGLEGHGGWNKDDTSYTMNIYGAKQKKEANWDRINARLSNYGPSGYIHFLYKKAAWTWGDGTYYACCKLSRKPLHSSKLHDYVLSTGTHYNEFKQVCDGYQMLLLLLTLVSAGHCLLKKDFNILFLLQVTLFGICIFLLLWETRSRYLLNFVPLLLVTSIDGVLVLYNTLRNHMSQFLKR